MGRLLCTGVLEGLGTGELTFEVGLNGVNRVAVEMIDFVREIQVGLRCGQGGMESIGLFQGYRANGRGRQVAKLGERHRLRRGRLG